MNNFATFAVLAVLALVIASLRNTYGHTSEQELTRRAAGGDKAADAIYLVARHGRTADIFLLWISILTASGAILIAGRTFSPLAAYLASAILLSLVLIYKPGRPSKISVKLAQMTASYIAWLLDMIRPYTNKVSQFMRSHRHSTADTGLYEKEDLIAFIKDQKKSKLNRIKDTELDSAVHALNFGEKKVKDFMVQKSDIHFIDREEPIGPILMSELHDSGHTRFPVLNHEDKVVGTLYLKDLIERKTSGIVANVMSPDVYFIGESEPLEKVLGGFIATKHHIFIVVNKSQEIAGLITVEDVIEQITGRKMDNESDEYGHSNASEAEAQTTESSE